MFNFVRKHFETAMKCLLIYVIGPLQAILFFVGLINSPKTLLELIEIWGVFSSPIIMGLLGILLTAIGVIDLYKRLRS